MRPRFLADEDFNQKIILGLLRREPTIDFQHAQEAGILGMPDLDVLGLATEVNRIVVSHDRKTMPGHFSRFIRARSSAGLIIIAKSLDIRTAIDELIMLWGASEAQEWTNRIRFLPLRSSARQSRFPLLH